MRAVRRRLRLYAWLALLSITCLAICPSVSRLLAPAHELPHGTVALLHATSVPSDHHHHHDGLMQGGMLPAASHEPVHQHSLDHCDFCVLAAHAVAVAPVPAALLAASVCRRQAFNGHAPVAPRLRCDWSPASPRGPPLA